MTYLNLDICYILKKRVSGTPFSVDVINTYRNILNSKF